MKFPVCRHGHTEMAAALRHCGSPKLVGLKVVSPQQCERCYCRDHELKELDESRHLLPCAFLGHRRSPHATGLNQATDGEPPSTQQLDEVYQCHHHRHDLTTLRECQGCADYLFPLVTPNMPTSMVQQLIALPPREQSPEWSCWENVQTAHRAAAAHAIQQTPAWPSRFAGRGIVIVGGGRYFVSAYVTIRVLRYLGCQLPIELWHLDGEMDDEMRAIVALYDVTCKNAEQLSLSEPYRFLPGHWWRGWQLKAFALRNCSFREVLLLDSDSYPVRNPEFLFDWPQYRELGAIFWPDLERNRAMIPDHVWPIFGIEPMLELPTESGQLLVNKELCWREVNLALHYNAHADFVYRILYGDKDTFPIAWHRLGRRYGRLWPNSVFDTVAIHQLDDQGKLLFIHRVHDKFRRPETKFDGTPQQSHTNQFQPHFPLEEFCFKVVAELSSRDSSQPGMDKKSPEAKVSVTPQVAQREFFVGIPVLNRYDLLTRCIDAALSSTLVPKMVYVINNGRENFEHSSPKVHLIKSPSNLGVARSWNLLQKLCQPADLIVLNDDIEVATDLFEKMLSLPDQVVATGFGIFLIRSLAWKQIGEFDETFYPAYFEDNDYYRRLTLAGYTTVWPEGGGYKDNGPSGTIAAFNETERSAFNKSFEAGKKYYVSKWGGLPHAETFTIPFGGLTPAVCP